MNVLENLKTKAYQLGVDASKNENGSCIPAFNVDLMEIIGSMPIGGYSLDLIKSFVKGVEDGIEEGLKLNVN